MKIVLWIFLVLLFLYLVFVLAPSVFSFLYSYSRREGKDLDTLPVKWLQKTQYRDHLDRIFQGNRWYREQAEKMPVYTIQSFDGLKLAAHYLDQGAKKLAILVHGFHTTVGNNFGVIAQDLVEFGWNLLFVDQRCFGSSEGHFCCYGLKEQYDVLSWIDFAEKEFRPEEILLFGVSMGGATVSFASDKIDNPKVKLAVNDCAFTSIYELQMPTAKIFRVPGKVMMPYVEHFTKWFLGINIRQSTEESLRNAKVPFFFIHGAADEAVPLEWGNRNYAACGSEKEQLVIEDAGHAVAYIASGDDGKEKLRQILNQYFS